MSLSDLAAIGSFISGIAVFLSFVFLSLQLRQANRNQRSLMQQARTGRNLDTLLKMPNPPISALLARAESSPADLGRAEIWSFYGFVGAVFWAFEDSYMQFKPGTLHPAS